jgi:predicted transcriptional regulator
MNKNIPDTSHEAYKMATPEMLSEHHSKIILALQVLGRATSEEIAAYLNWEDRNRAARRMSELEANSIVFKPGEKRKTKYGRNAYVYQLINKEKKYSVLELF